MTDKERIEPRQEDVWLKRAEEQAPVINTAEKGFYSGLEQQLNGTENAVRERLILSANAAHQKALAECRDIGCQSNHIDAIIDAILADPIIARHTAVVPAVRVPEGLRALSEKATRGPWKVESEIGSDNFARSIYEDDYKGLLIGRIDQNGSSEDASFIVALVNWVRSLLSDPSAAEAKPKWECAARKQSTAGGNDPADCDWPMCGCDPHADKVIEALQECGHLVHAAEAKPAGAMGWQVPDGWKLVPINIADEDGMLDVGHDYLADGREWGHSISIAELWDAMLAAAPAPTLTRP